MRGGSSRSPILDTRFPYPYSPAGPETSRPAVRISCGFAEPILRGNPMKSIRPLLFVLSAILLASLGLMPLAAGPRYPGDAPRVQQPPAPTPAPQQTPPDPELKDKQ